MVYKSRQIFLPFCHNSRVWQLRLPTVRNFSAGLRGIYWCSVVRQLADFPYGITVGEKSQISVTFLLYYWHCAAPTRSTWLPLRAAGNGAPGSWLHRVIALGYTSLCTLSASRHPRCYVTLLTKFRTSSQRPPEMHIRVGVQNVWLVCRLEVAAIPPTSFTARVNGV